MKNFNWDEKVAVHCDTQEKANDFLKQAHEHELMWEDGDSLLYDNHYEIYFEQTCYRWCNGLWCGNVSYYCENNYKIIEWEIDEMKEFTVKDLKVGMLVENNYSKTYGLALVMPSKTKNVLAYYSGKWGTVEFDNITRVWGYSDEHETLTFYSKDRELLYKRKELKKMTVKEICKELGYDVEIVKE